MSTCEFLDKFIYVLILSSFHAYNIGHLSSRASTPLFSPCTPSGCIALLEATGVPIAGTRAVVLGRSDIVGNPVAAMLRAKDATVTQCHSRTKNLEEIVRRSSINILFTAYDPNRYARLIFWWLPLVNRNMLKANG